MEGATSRGLGPAKTNAELNSRGGAGGGSASASPINTQPGQFLSGLAPLRNGPDDGRAGRSPRPGAGARSLEGIDAARGGVPTLASLLDAHRGSLFRFVRRNAASLLRHESDEDLVQGILVRALVDQDRFVYRGEREFLGWLTRVARGHLAKRHRYWSVRGRRAARATRLTVTTIGGGSTPRELSAGGAGPRTALLRREELGLVGRAIAVLLPRDRALLQWSSEGIPVEEVARRLGLTRETAGRVRLRALERFRSAFEAISGRRSGSSG